MHAALGKHRVRCGRKRVARLMRREGLRGCERRVARVRTTVGDPAATAASDLVERAFSPAGVVRQSGNSAGRAVLTRGGTRAMKQMLYLIALKAVQQDGEWAQLYARLVPRKCAYDERTRSYRGKMAGLGRIAGQITTMIFAFLKADRELLDRTLPGNPVPEPRLYDPAVHRAHRHGQYRPLKPYRGPAPVILLPTR